jgi:Icc-related predicted phosphoesterase
MTAHRVFFSVDVHGSTLVWRKWLAAVDYYKVDTVMLCGDLTGKMIVPIIKQSDGTYLVRFFKREWKLKSSEEIENMKLRIENSGNYPLITTPEEVERLRKNPSEVDLIMRKAILERIRKWLNLAVEKIDTKTKQLIVMPGNDDIFDVDDVIKEYEDRGIIYPLHKVIEIAGVETISFDYVNPTPWETPRELKEEEMRKRIEGLVSMLRDPSQSIFNFHCPPYNTRLDLAPKLDKSLKPVTVGGEVVFEHVGSKAVRNALIKYKPQIGLHGHIHESGGIDKLDGVPIVNPGSEYGEGVLRGILFEIENKKVIKYWRIEG